MIQVATKHVDLTRISVLLIWDTNISVTAALNLMNLKSQKNFSMM